MTWTDLILFILIVQVIHFAGTWKFYVAAGRKAWEAAVPVYNAVVLMKIINRPWWWVILLFIPIVHLIMFPVVWVETLRSFGRNNTKETFLVLFTLGFYLYYVNYTQKLTHIPDRELKPRTSAGEWTSSILFAVVAATIVHNYFMQPYTIPTSSLEKTLLVGDYLFVSKFHYGAKAPMTAVSLPMVHDRIPGTEIKSYNKSFQYPYFRLPGVQKIKHNDIVVFGWPVDTLTVITDPTSKVDIKPMDKKSNYVKRCVGLPGDSLAIKDGYVYVNGVQNELPDRAKLQFSYRIASKNFLVTRDSKGNPSQTPTPVINERYGISDIIPVARDNDNNIVHIAQITEEAAAKLKNLPGIASIERTQVEENAPDASGNIFPQDARYPWNTRYFGPIYIPEAGATVEINSETIPFYERIIEVYEGSELGINNKITQNGTQVLLNGQPITEYTFKQDYYWMMGDNRDNSQDARSWGYVPFNHVVGKPVFIWMSFNKFKKFPSNIRWDRVFTTVGGGGEPVSYFRYFLIVLVGWIGFNFFRKKRKEKNKEA
ncbi:MAG: signal peptidase I [Flavobacteriaceae bacterium]|nr:signal peptidase I [Flavobacteriaceae bacterium]